MAVMATRAQRILWLIDYFPRPHEPMTGIWALETAAALAQQGLEVTVLALTPWIPAWAGVTRRLRGWAAVPDRVALRGLSVYYPKAPYYPSRTVARLVYHRLPWLDGPWLWRWCAHAAEALMRERRCQVAHANFIFPNAFLGGEIKRRYRIPLVVHERSPQRLAAALAHPTRRALYAGALREADALITLNQGLAAQLRALAPDPRLLVLPAAANLQAAVRSRQPRPAAYARRKVILSVGALNERKGHAVLLRALALLRSAVPEAHLILIGHGPLRRRLERLIGSLGLSGSVELWGARPHAEVLGAMSWCDVFAMPSWGESFGTVYAEAMSCGKPVIGCAGEGFTELARHGVHAWHVPPRDAGALAQAIQQLLSDTELAARLGRGGASLVRESLTFERIAGELRRLYDELLA